METIDRPLLEDIPQLADLLTLLFTQEADFEPRLCQAGARAALLI